MISTSEMLKTSPHERFPGAADRTHVTPLAGQLKAALALAFWTALGLVLAIQSCLLWPKATFADAIRRWVVASFARDTGSLEQSGVNLSACRPAGSVIPR